MLSLMSMLANRTNLRPRRGREGERERKEAGDRSTQREREKEREGGRKIDTQRGREGEGGRERAGETDRQTGRGREARREREAKRNTEAEAETDKTRVWAVSDRQRRNVKVVNIWQRTDARAEGKRRRGSEGGAGCNWTKFCFNYFSAGALAAFCP